MGVEVIISQLRAAEAPSCSHLPSSWALGGQWSRGSPLLTYRTSSEKAPNQIQSLAALFQSSDRRIELSHWISQSFNLTCRWFWICLLARGDERGKVPSPARGSSELQSTTAQSNAWSCASRLTFKRRQYTFHSREFGVEIFSERLNTGTVLPGTDRMEVFSTPILQSRKISEGIT